MQTPSGICKATSSVQGCQPSANAPNIAPGLTLQNLYGCTININNNCNQILNPTSQTLTEVNEIDKLIAAIVEPNLP